MREFALLFAISIIFIGCSTTLLDDEQISRQMKIKSAFSNNISQKFESSGISTPLDTPLDQMSYMLNVKELDPIMLKALRNNPNVLISVSKITQAKASISSNTANMLPSISGSLNPSASKTQKGSLPTNPSTSSSSTSGSLNLSWEIDLFGKLNALRGSAKENFLNAKENLLNAQISLLSDVATYYFTYSNLQKSIELTNERIKNLNTLYLIAKAKYEEGLGALSDVITARNSLTTEQNSLESYKYQSAQNLNALRVLLDDMSFTPNVERVYLKSPRAINPSKIPSLVLLNRADVKAQIHALNSQMYKETSAKAARAPTLSLSGSISQVLAGMLNVGDITSNIAATLSTPLLNRKGLHQTYLIEQENTKQAMYNLSQIINTAISEMENAIVSENTTSITLSNNTYNYQSLGENYSVDFYRYEDGLIDNATLLNTTNAYLLAERNLYSARLEHIKSYITLYKAFGAQVYKINSSRQVTKIAESNIKESND